MSKVAPTLSASIDSMMLDGRDGESVIKMIRVCIGKHPALIEELFPGKRLVKARMSSADRTKLASKAAAEASKEAAMARYELIVPIIAAVLEEDPTASLAQIKVVLDNSGIEPLRSAKWSRATIAFIMQRNGFRAKDQP
jgi:hypothetical protein